MTSVNGKSLCYVPSAGRDSLRREFIRQAVMFPVITAACHTAQKTRKHRMCMIFTAVCCSLKKKKTEHRVHSQGYFPLSLTVILKLPSYCEKKLYSEQKNFRFYLIWTDSVRHLKTTAGILTQPLCRWLSVTYYVLSESVSVHTELRHFVLRLSIT